MIGIRQAAKLAFKNKEAIQATKICSCYCCCARFAPEEIKEWTDNHLTPFCPKCGIDAVLPMDVEETELKKIKEYWFGDLHSDPSGSGR